MNAIPDRIERPSWSDALATISRAVFQAGLSWAVIAAKWDAYLRLFEGFDPERVAHFDDTDVERILADGGVVRTRRKIVATLANARAVVALADGYPGVGAYFAAYAPYERLATDLQARFAFLGALSAYYVVFRLGGVVPRFEDWERTIPGEHPRMREMIARAREQGWQG